MKAATFRVREYYAFPDISIHAAREGGDVGNAVFVPTVIKFQSTPPVKAATITTNTKKTEILISIHAAREGGDYHHM